MTVLALFAALMLLIKPDPTPGLFQSEARARRYTCERVSLEEVGRRKPGVVKPSPPRGEMAERIPIICSERLLREGLREARDEAILSSLEERATELTASARALRPDLHDRTWLVEVFYPDADVSSKIDFATKAAFMRHGAVVTDRMVTLAAGDVDVLTRMSPYDAYPSACRRYAQTGSVAGNDALLAIVSLDPRETTLHAGICDAGEWMWLR